MTSMYTINNRRKKYFYLFFKIITEKSFIDLVRYLFSVPGVKSFLSRRLCQDPLEKFFGLQRQIGRAHDNTTVKEFQQNMQALKVVNSFCRGSVRSNCRENEDLSVAVHDDYLLPKSWKTKQTTEVNITTPTELGNYHYY